MEAVKWFRRRAVVKLPQSTVDAITRASWAIAIRLQHQQQRVVVDDMPLDLKLAARDLRATCVDVRAICDMLARVLEQHIPDDMLPPDRLEARRDKKGQQ